MINIIITGCSTGIGLETAKYLRDHSILVYPTARSSKDVKMLKDLGFEDAMQLDVKKLLTVSYGFSDFFSEKTNIYFFISLGSEYPAITLILFTIIAFSNELFLLT